MIVLASASPRRRELLTQAGVAFRTDPADTDETPPVDASPEEAALAIATRKARAVAGRAAAGEIVLGADTVVAAADGELLAKPEDDDDARRMLRKLCGTTHRVVTGVCVVRSRERFERAACETTLVTMRAARDDEIDAYVATGECFGKAGAYAIQETGDRFVTRVEGSWTNVVGLPVETALRLLREAGAQV